MAQTSGHAEFSGDSRRTLFTPFTLVKSIFSRNKGRYSQLSPDDDGETSTFIQDDHAVADIEEIAEKPHAVRTGFRRGVYRALLVLFSLIIGVWIMVVFLRWALTGKRDDFGCADAPHVYNGAKTVYSVPVGEVNQDHFLDVRGGAVGNIFLTQGSNTSRAVTVDLLLRTSDPLLLRGVFVQQDDPIPSPVKRSFWRLTTPRTGSHCMHYDVVLRVPPTLRKLHVAAHAIAHVKFDDSPDVKVALDDLFVTFFSERGTNLLTTSTNVQSTRTSLEMVGGRMEGRVALLQRTRILTQRGNANANIDVVILPDYSAASTASLDTVTGAGRSSISLTDPFKRTAALESSHLSVGNGRLDLHYEKSGFNGQVEIEAHDWTGQGLQGGDPIADAKDSPQGGVSMKTLWAGNRGGRDKVLARSLKGYVGLYF